MASKKKITTKRGGKPAKEQAGGRMHLRAESKLRVREYHALAKARKTSLTALVVTYLDQLLEEERRGLFDAEQI